MIEEDKSGEYLKIGVETVREAGALLQSKREVFKVTEHEADRDLKIRGDRELDIYICEKLSHASGVPVLSEESPGRHDPFVQGDLLWIVDPLDGSMNFSRGLELGCISIALWEEGKPLLGIVYDFNRDRLYSGGVHSHAMMNGRPLRVSTVDRPEKAVLATGFPVKTDLSTRSVTRFIDAVQHFKKIRMLGTAALSLAMVASGVIDAYTETDILIWDVAAGLSLVQSAGGLYEIRPGISRFSCDVLATNKNLFKNEHIRFQQLRGKDGKI